MADATQTTALVEQPHGAEHEVEPAALGLTPGMWVAAAMLVFLLVLVWKKVPAALTGGLDKRIATIRSQLDEAKALRAEAETLRAEYAARIANAEKDAAAMLAHARTEADAIVAKAAADATDVIARRERMAQDKIAASERAVVDELRAKAGSLATAAAVQLIAGNLGRDADRALVDGTIAAIAH